MNQGGQDGGYFHFSMIDYTMFAVMLLFSASVGIYFGFFKYVNFVLNSILCKFSTKFR